MPDITTTGSIIEFKDGTSINGTVETTQYCGREALRIYITDETKSFNELKDFFKNKSSLEEISVKSIIVEDDGTQVPAITTYFDYIIFLKLEHNIKTEETTASNIVTLGQITQREKTMDELKKKLNDNQSGIIELASIIEEDK